MYAWEMPTLLYVSGPVSYLERDVGRDAIERAIDQLVRVMDATGCRVIMDHHALRDAAGKSRTIAAKGEERAFLWPPVNTAEDISHGIRHHLESGAGNIERCLLDALVEGLCDVLFDDFARPFCVELA